LHYLEQSIDIPFAPFSTSVRALDAATGRTAPRGTALPWSMGDRVGSSAHAIDYCDRCALSLSSRAGTSGGWHRERAERPLPRCIIFALRNSMFCSFHCSFPCLESIPKLCASGPESPSRRRAHSPYRPDTPCSRSLPQAFSLVLAW